jgi:hypothetical protein
MLPKIDLPIYELTLPSTGEKIKYRPFTVKEEKILLVASESDDPSQEIIAAKQVVNNCLIENSVTDFAMFDLEIVLLTLRSRSVDNTINFKVTDPDTEEEVELIIDLEETKVTKDPEHTNQIKINDQYTLFLKYPTIDEFIKIAEMNPEDPLVNYMIMVSCLDKVASADESYSFKNYSQSEVDEFMENIEGGVVAGIQKFFETMPKVRHEIKYTNGEGTDKTFVIEGMRSFFI